jgi:MFS family permease
VLGVAAYGQFGFSMFVLGMGAVAPLLQLHYGLSLSQTGVVLAAANVGPVLCLVLWGVINDRFGEGWSMAAGLTGAALALASVSLTTSFMALCLAILVAGGLGSTANVSTGRAVIAAFQPPMRGLALGLRQTASPLGGALAGLALPAIAAKSGAGDAFLLLSVIVLLGAIAAIIFPRRPPTRTPPAKAAESPVSDSPHPAGVAEQPMSATRQVSDAAEPFIGGSPHLASGAEQPPRSANAVEPPAGAVVSAGPGGTTGLPTGAQPRTGSGLAAGAGVEVPIRFSDPRIWRLGVASGILLAPQAVVVALTAVMLTSGRGMTALAAGAVLGGVQLAGALLRALLGYWGDRWGRPVRTLRWTSLAISAGIAVIGLCFYAPIWVTIGVVVAFGSLSMSWNSVSMGLVGEYGGDSRSGYALGLHGTMLFVAASVAVPLFTAIVESTSWTLAFLALALCPILAWFLLRRLPNPVLPVP